MDVALPAGVDPAELTELAAELAASSFHRQLREYATARLACLQADDVTDPAVAMKRRGQTEELARLLLPAFPQALALAALTQRAADRARVTATAAAQRPTPPWWADHVEEPIP
jgi:hypothetical protein